MPAAVLVTGLFPPTVGGSAELFGNVYSRLGSVPVTVVTTPQDGSCRANGRFEVADTLPENLSWGVASVTALLGHSRAVRAIWPHAGNAVIHCGRALPEGLAAYATRMIRGTRYICWTHGEELGYVGLSWELRRLTRLVLSGASALIANSRNTRSMMHQLGADDRRIRVIYPGVDALRFRPEADGRHAMRARLIGTGDTLLLTVGRLQRRKGHDRVIAALGALCVRFPGLRYAIVGDGPERSRLEQLAREHGVATIVRFVGAVSAAELPACYAAADLFVHPNRIDGPDFEGFGIVFLEAAAAGLPVIAGRSGGAPEAVIEDETGVLVDGIDAAELVARIADLVESPQRRRSLGAAGRLRAKTEFTWDRAAHEVLQVHSEVARLN